MHRLYDELYPERGYTELHEVASKKTCHNICSVNCVAQGAMDIIGCELCSINYIEQA